MSYSCKYNKILILTS